MWFVDKTRPAWQVREWLHKELEHSLPWLSVTATGCLAFWRWLSFHLSLWCLTHCTPSTLAPVISWCDPARKLRTQSLDLLSPLYSPCIWVTTELLLCFSSFFLFLAVLVFELRTLYLPHPLFAFFQVVSQVFAQGQSQTTIFLPLPPRVAGLQACANLGFCLFLFF
jgi:hypothetical protein